MNFLWASAYLLKYSRSFTLWNFFAGSMPKCSSFCFSAIYLSSPINFATIFIASSYDKSCRLPWTSSFSLSKFCKKTEQKQEIRRIRRSKLRINIQVPKQQQWDKNENQGISAYFLAVQSEIVPDTSQQRL
jgi:hypothetical protein